MASGSSVLPVLEEDPTVMEGSSNCPAGVRSSPPSGLNVNRRKKFVKLSSPYNLTDDHAFAGNARMAGSAGIGDGDRPYRLECAGEPGALTDDRRDEAAFSTGGGNIVALVMGVVATEVAGVEICGTWLDAPPNPNPARDAKSSRVCSLKLVAIDSVSLAVDKRRAMWGRPREGVVRV
jgi:hypothetical protein